MPYYIAQGVNKLTASGVEKGVNGLLLIINLSITAVKNIVLFIINIITQTYICLITLAISKSLYTAVQLRDKVVKILNSTIPVIRDDITSITSTFKKDFNSFINSIKSIPFANINLLILNLNTDIKKLKNLVMPINISIGLQDFNNSIPTFTDIQNFTKIVIKFPFKEVKKLISETLGNFTFNYFLLPIP